MGAKPRPATTTWAVPSAETAMAPRPTEVVPGMVSVSREPDASVVSRAQPGLPPPWTIVRR